MAIGLIMVVGVIGFKKIMEDNGALELIGAVKKQDAIQQIFGPNMTFGLIPQFVSVRNGNTKHTTYEIDIYGNNLKGRIKAEKTNNDWISLAYKVIHEENQTNQWIKVEWKWRGYDS